MALPDLLWSFADVGRTAEGLIELEFTGARLVVTGWIEPALAAAVVSALEVCGDRAGARSVGDGGHPADRHFRHGMNGLAALVPTALKANPYCGDVFVFRPKRGDRLRLISWTAVAWC